MTSGAARVRRAASTSPLSKKPVRLAVVGLGYWGPNLIRNAVELDCTEVAYACDLEESALAAVKRRYPAVRTTQSYDEVLADEDVEAVIIATPISTHYRLAAMALETGKHVLVEKPLAASSGEAAELIELAGRRNLLLMPGHTFLYSPPVNKVKEFLTAGAIGDIYFISMSRVNLGLHQADVSVLWDLAPHDFSILRYWLEETPTKLSAISRDCIGSGVPDVAFVNLLFGSGAVAHVELSWLAPSKLRRTTIVGSRKMIVYDDTSREPVRVFDFGVHFRDPETFGEYQLSYRTGDILSPNIEVVEPLVMELVDFCGAIREAREPRSNARLGLDVVRMIESAQQAIDQDVVGTNGVSLDLVAGLNTRSRKAVRNARAGTR
jgi:predicted dehydrogenase